MNLEKVLEFIKDKRGYNYPLRYKLVNGLPLTKEELYVDGDLYLSESKIISLPDNLYVNGNLYLSKSKIKVLPNNLKVGGSLDLCYTKITTLPDNLKVTGDLYINYTYVETIPNNLNIWGYFFIYNTPLSERYSKEEIRKMIEDKGGYLGRYVAL